MLYLSISILWHIYISTSLHFRGKYTRYKVDVFIILNATSIRRVKDEFKESHSLRKKAAL